jgi:hypothetical protein
MKKIMSVSIIASAAILFTACTGSSVPVVEKSPSFKLGQEDGCATASGTYTKDSNSFKNNQDYYNGWFYGRKNCNPANSRK